MEAYTKTWVPFEVSDLRLCFQIGSNRPAKVGRNVFEKAGRNFRRVEMSGNRLMHATKTAVISLFIVPIFRCKQILEST